MLLYDATQKDIYKNDLVATMTDWSPSGSVDYTPKCLAWRIQWGSLRYMGQSIYTPFFFVSVALRPQKPYALLGTGGRQGMRVQLY